MNVLRLRKGLQPHPEVPCSSTCPILRTAMWPSIQKEGLEWPSDPGRVRGCSLQAGWERCQWVFFLLSCAWGMCRATGLCFQGLAALRPNRHSLHWGKSCKSKNCFEIKNWWKLYYHKGDGLSSYLPVHLQPVEFKVTWDKCVCSTESTLIYPPWTTSRCAIHLWKSSDLPSTKVIL